MGIVVGKSSCLNVNDTQITTEKESPILPDLTIPSEYSLRKSSSWLWPCCIRQLQLCGKELFCLTGRSIKVYSSEDLSFIREIHFSHKPNSFYRTISGHILTAASCGVFVNRDNGEQIQVVAVGTYGWISFSNKRLYAYDHRVNLVLIFRQTQYFWEIEKSLTLDYFCSKSKEAIPKSGKESALKMKVNLADLYSNYYHGRSSHHPDKINSFMVSANNIYLSDDSLVHRMDENGHVIQLLFPQTTVDKSMKNPVVCHVTHKGYSLVIDRDNIRLFVFSPSGTGKQLTLKNLKATSLRYVVTDKEFQRLWVAYNVNDEVHISLFTR